MMVFMKSVVIVLIPLSDKGSSLDLMKMTTKVVEISVTNSNLSKDYSHPDDHNRQTTDTPGFKPFTKNIPIITKYLLRAFILVVIPLGCIW